ncbi:MAG: hypothetical protein R3D34_03395 [Nitratireductor sp.]
MTTLPDDVRLSVLADQARVAMGDETGKPADGENPTSSQKTELSQEELLFRARQKQMIASNSQPADTEPATSKVGGDQTDPRALFARAMELRQSADKPVEAADEIAQVDGQSDGQEFEKPVSDPSPDEAADTPSTVDVWKRALALRQKTGASPSPASESPDPVPADMASYVAEPADTAAIAAQTQAIMVPSAEDLFIFSISPEIARQSDGREILDPETYVQLALRRKGARQPRHITIGRIKGDGYEVFKSAQEQANAITRIVGGEPTIGYDPELAAGQVRIEYLPARSHIAKEQSS